MFVINPADMAWWAWWLAVLVASTVSFVAGLVATTKKDSGFLSWSICILFGFGAFICSVIGIIRFVKWAWEG